LRDDSAQLDLVQIGCGGNGSHLIEALARITRLLTNEGQAVNLTLIDPDHVEPDNIPRQNFSTAEIGLNKAQLLALRYSAKWGLTIKAIPDYFENQSFHTYNALTLFIGCVDNTPARASISKAMTQSDYQRSPRAWWLDLGNGLDTGQVVLGSANTLRDLEFAFQLNNVCTATPAPGLLHPSLLDDKPKRSQRQAPTPTAAQGCAQLAMTNEQMPVVNQMTAAIGAAMLTKLLVTRDLKYWASYFDLSTGKQVSYASSPQAIEDALVNVKSGT